ncbi:hypothetical protein GNF10_07840 [Nostoc sp. UCD121]|uniref:hypothetical protein n=1 Tax=unclassified Nostoc TaxID=2593658 RepID=UPI001624A3E7|nr:MULTISPECIES: hypothetical protein [unclassified Nostoc]MBC1222020.1 hypothetical protein [Nostoc sp. UCD120]MBC1275901.1 hypothetical protein [Nostoc sp. UCD121]MBC1293611.1 hypothetical protein [Nostoc sp. UCD122]
MEFQKLLSIFTLVKIATFALSVPVFAQITQIPSNSSQSSCRATKVDTPIFKEPSTSSNAIRILSAQTRITLAYIPVSGDRFVRIKSPSSGFIQTAVLKFCQTNNNTQNLLSKPTIGSVCRQIVQTETLRRQPSLKGDYITTLYPNAIVFVNLVTGNVVKSHQSENYIWVEIDLSRSFPGELSGNGWIANTDLVNTPRLSSLAYCS